MRVVRGTKGNDTLSSGYWPMAVKILAGEGDDTLYGSHLDDFLFGEGGKDTIIANQGDDVIEGGAGGDAIDGGDDIDTASYESSDAGVKVDLGAGRGSGGHAEGDRLRNVENLTGSRFADALVGNEIGNVLKGGAGDDDLYGKEGDDTLEGGAGGDALDGGADTDTASYAGSASNVKVSLATGDAAGGDADGDTLTNIENLTGSAFGDYLGGDAGDNVLDGGAGDDFLEGGAGKNTLIGGDGVDTASYAASSSGVGVDLAFAAMVVDVNGDGIFNNADDVNGDGTLDELDAADTLASIENLIGSAFNDQMHGDANVNRFSGGDGDDIMSGRDGDDVLDGGAGDDDLHGGAHNDELWGGLGRDELRGSIGDDDLFGGDDVDALSGGIDSDWLEGGAGGDALDGGNGTDTASYASSNAGVFVDLENGTATGGHALNDTLTSIESLAGSIHGDVLLGTNGDNKIEGGDGDDVIRGRSGVDEIWGGAGDDTFVIDESDDSNSILAWNIEVIADFTAGGSEDAIDLTNAGTGYTSLADILANSEVVTGENGATGLMIDLGPSGAVLLVGIEAGQLTQSDFVFG